jgi:hypothetical protein
MSLRSCGLRLRQLRRQHLVDPPSVEVDDSQREPCASMALPTSGMLANSCSRKPAMVCYFLESGRWILSSSENSMAASSPRSGKSRRRVSTAYRVADAGYKADWNHRHEFCISYVAARRPP